METPYLYVVSQPLGRGGVASADAETKAAVLLTDLVKMHQEADVFSFDIVTSQRHGATATTTTGLPAGRHAYCIKQKINLALHIARCLLWRESVAMQVPLSAYEQLEDEIVELARGEDRCVRWPLKNTAYRGESRLPLGTAAFLSNALDDGYTDIVDDAGAVGEEAPAPVVCVGGDEPEAVAAATRSTSPEAASLRLSLSGLQWLEELLSSDMVDEPRRRGSTIELGHGSTIECKEGPLQATEGTEGQWQAVSWEQRG